MKSLWVSITSFACLTVFTFSSAQGEVPKYLDERVREAIDCTDVLKGPAFFDNGEVPENRMDYLVSYRRRNAFAGLSGRTGRLMSRTSDLLRVMNANEIPVLYTKDGTFIDAHLAVDHTLYKNGLKQPRGNEKQQAEILKKAEAAFKRVQQKLKNFKGIKADLDHLFVKANDLARLAAYLYELDQEYEEREYSGKVLVVKVPKTVDPLGVLTFEDQTKIKVVRNRLLREHRLILGHLYTVRGFSNWSRFYKKLSSLWTWSWFTASELKSEERHQAELWRQLWVTYTVFSSRRSQWDEQNDKEFPADLQSVTDDLSNHVARETLRLKIKVLRQLLNDLPEEASDPKEVEETIVDLENLIVDLQDHMEPRRWPLLLQRFKEIRSQVFESFVLLKVKEDRLKNLGLNLALGPDVVKEVLKIQGQQTLGPALKKTGAGLVVISIVTLIGPYLAKPVSQLMGSLGHRILVELQIIGNRVNAQWMSPEKIVDHCLREAGSQGEKAFNECRLTIFEHRWSEAIQHIQKFGGSLTTSYSWLGYEEARREFLEMQNLAAQEWIAFRSRIERKQQQEKTYAQSYGDSNKAHLANQEAQIKQQTLEGIEERIKMLTHLQPLVEQSIAELEESLKSDPLNSSSRENLALKKSVLADLQKDLASLEEQKKTLLSE